MSFEAVVKGNLLGNPVTKHVRVGDADRSIVEFRVMADAYKRSASGELIQDEDKTHPVRVTLWHEQRGQQYAKLLRTGMRVQVRGTMYPHIYKREQGDDFFELRMDADDICLALNRVLDIEMKPGKDKSDKAQENQTQGAMDAVDQ